MRRAPLVLGALAATATTAFAVQRSTARSWRAHPDELVEAGLVLPEDLEHHQVEVDDGGRLHVVERGHGPTVVLLHGVTLGVEVWVHQLRTLAADHRVLAVGQRGHGRSVAGTDGYSIDRLARDLLAVLDALAVTDAVLVGHSMGGMVAQVAALDHGPALGPHVASLVLAATAAATPLPGPGRGWAARALAAGADRSLHFAERHGWGLLPQQDLAAWVTRVNFGSHPRPADIELTRSMVMAMSPGAMADLTGPLLGFDVADRLGQVALPTTVVVGDHDLVTPPRAARVLARGIPGAELSVLAGCGHMVMLERPEELDRLVRSAAPTRRAAAAPTRRGAAAPAASRRHRSSAR